MKAADAHALGDQDLVEQLKEARQEAFNLRFRHATGELENTAGLGGSRRDLARLLTVARERGIDLDKELKMSETKRRTKQTPDEATEAAGGPCRRGSRRGAGRRGAAGRGGSRRGGAGAAPRSPRRPRSPRPRSRRPPRAEDAEPEEVLTPEAAAQARPLAAHRRGAAAARSRRARRRARRAAREGRRRSRAAAARRRAPSTSRGEGTPPAERAARLEEGAPGHGRLEQGRQDDHRPASRSSAATRSTRRSSAARRRSTPTTRRNEANAGDVVRVIESRPLSRTKRWRLVEVLERARRR